MSSDEVLDDIEVNEAIPQSGYVGFSLRELGIFLVTIVLILATIFGPSLTNGIAAVFLAAGPLLAAILLIVRRLTVARPTQVGSLSTDQFASVACTVALIAWIQLIVAGFVAEAPIGVWDWLGLIAAGAGVALTAGAPHLPVLRDDFVGRPDALANTVAAPPRPIIEVPRLPREDAAGEALVDEAPEELADTAELDAEAEARDAEALDVEELDEIIDSDLQIAPPAPPAKD